MAGRREFTEQELRERVVKRREQTRERMAQLRARRRAQTGVTQPPRNDAHSRENAVTHAPPITPPFFKDSLGFPGGPGGDARHTPGGPVAVRGVVVNGCYYPASALQRNPGPPPGVLVQFEQELERIDLAAYGRWLEARARAPLEAKLAEALAGAG